MCCLRNLDVQDMNENIRRGKYANVLFSIFVGQRHIHYLRKRTLHKSYPLGLLTRQEELMIPREYSWLCIVILLNTCQSLRAIQMGGNQYIFQLQSANSRLMWTHLYKILWCVSSYKNNQFINCQPCLNFVPFMVCFGMPSKIDVSEFIFFF